MADERTIRKMMDILKSNPKDVSAFKGLENEYFLSHNWKKLSELYQFRADAIKREDSGESAKLFAKSGEIEDKRIGNREQAIKSYQNAFALQPRRKEYGDALVGIYWIQENWSHALDVLRRQVEFVQHNEHKVAILLKIAYIYKDKLQDKAEAKKILTHILQLDKKQQEALQYLEELYYQDSQWPEMINLYQISIQSVTEPEAKYKLLERSALLCRDQLKDLAKAAQFYTQMHQITPNNMNLLKELEQIYSTLEQWNFVIDVLGKQLHLIPDAVEKSKLFIRMAMLWSDKLQNTAECVRCYEEALKLDENDTTLKILEDIHRKQEDWKKLAAIYQKQAARTQVEVIQIDLFCKIGKIAKTYLNDFEMAILWYEKAHNKNPKNFELLKTLQELLKHENKHEALIKNYYEEIELIADDSEKIIIYYKIAHIYYEQNNLPLTAQIYEQVLEKYPTHRKSIEQLKNIYRSLKNYQALIKTLQREIALDPIAVENINIYLNMAEIFKTDLNSEKDAIECYSKVLSIDNTRLDVWELLYQYYKKENSHNELISVIKNIIKLDQKRSEELWLEIAIIYRDNLRDSNKAVEAFQNVLKVNSRNLEAIKSLAILYESLAQWENYIKIVTKQIELTNDVTEITSLHFSLCQVYQNQGNFKSEETHLLEILKVQFNNKRAVDRLKEICEQQEDWDKYIRTLIRELQIFSWSDEDQFSKLMKIAHLYEEKLADKKNAIIYFNKAKHLAPNNMETLEALEKLYTETKNYKSLISIMETKANLSEDEAMTKSFYYQIGTIWEEKLGEQTEAIKSLEKVISLDMGNVAALKKLELLHIERGNHEKLVDVYMKQSVASDKVDEKVALNLKIGTIWEEKLGNTQKAPIYYSQVVKLDPKNEQAIDHLLKLYRQQENWADLAPIYEKKIAITEDTSEIIRLAFELANIYKEHLQSLNKSIEVYSDILSLDPANIKAIHALKELYTKLSNWKALEETYRIEVGLEKDMAQRKALLIQMGELCEEKLLDFAKAINYYLEVVKLDSAHLETVRSLKKLYYKIQNYKNVIWAIDAEIKINTKPSEQVELFFEKGEVCTSRLLDFPSAVNSYEEILKIGPSNLKAYELLATLHKQQNSFNALVDILLRQVDISGADKQKELYTQAGQLWRENLANNDEAKKCFLSALKIDPTYVIARRELEGLYKSLSEWNDLIALYEEEIGFCQVNERLAQLYYLVGKTWEVELTQNEKALEFYGKVLEIEPHNLLTIKSLQKIYYEEDNYEKLLDAYQKELAIPSIDTERRITLHIYSAELQRFKLETLPEAINSYNAVLDFQLDINNLIAIRGLEDLYEQTQQYKELKSMYFKELELQKDKNRLIDVHVRLGCILEEKLNDIDDAIEHFSEAHLSRPKNLYILRRLKYLLREKNRWNEYSELLEKEIELLAFSQDIIPVRFDLLNVYDEHLDNFVRAIEHGEAILELEEDNIEVLQKLQSLYIKIDKSEKLVEKYLKEASLLDEAKTRDRLIFLNLESGKILFENLNNLELASECYNKVLKLDPPNKEALSKLVKVLTALKKWDDLIKLYDVASKITKNKSESEMLHIRMGELWEREFQDDQKAMLSYQVAYTLNNMNYSAVTGIRKIFERLERWGDAIEFLNIELYLVEEKKQPPLFLKMGELWEDKLDMPHQALTCYLKVMGHGFHRPTAERIMKIQEKVGDYQGLIEILEKDIKVTDNPEDITRKLLYLGKIHWKHLKNIDIAVETYTKVLKLDANQMEAIESLENLLEIQKKWSQLIAILNRKKENLIEPDMLLNTHRKIGDVYDQNLHSGNLAIRNYEFALELSPHDLELIHILQRLYEEWGYSKKLIALYQKETQLIENKDRIIYLYGRIGETWEKRLFEDEHSIRAYERLLELSPGHLGAIRALSRLYNRYQSWDKLIDVYNVLIKNAKESNNKEEEISFLMSLGKVYRDEVGKPEEAINVFSSVLELESAHEEALKSLEKLYKNLGKQVEMANLISQKIVTCDTKEKQLELYIHLGTLYEKELDDPDNAIEAFQYAHSLDETRLDVLKALDWLYLRKKMWEELANICSKEINLTEDLEEKAELCYRLGIIKRDRFQKQDEAKTLFLQAIEYKMDLKKALKALTGLAIMEEDWTQAVKYIAMEINYIDDPFEKVTTLNDLGALYQNKLKLIQKAKEAFQAALDIDPHSLVAIEAMADIHFTQNEMAKAEPLFGRLILLVDKSEAEKLSNIYYKWGTIADKLGKKDESIIRYSTALDIKKDNLEALMALGDVYFERAQWGFDKAQWKEALDIYEKVIEHPNLEDSKVTIIKKLAIIQASLDQVEAAITNYEKVLAEIPEDIESINALAKLHTGREEHEQALKYYEKLSKSEGSSFTDKRTALLSMGDALTILKRYQAAVDTFHRAFAMGVEDPTILQKIGELYIELEKWDDAQEWIDKHYTCLSEEIAKVENRCLAAKILIEGRNKPEESVALYKQALEASPTWMPAIRGIADIYSKQEKWELIAQEYNNFLTNLPQDKKAVGLPIHLALGAIYNERLGNQEGAIGEFTKALAIDKNHVAAHAALADIKAKDPNLQEESVKEHFFLLKRDPFRVDSYRGLYKLYREKEQFTKALRACNALALLSTNTEEEKKFIASVPVKKIHTLESKAAQHFMIPERGGVFYEVMALCGEHMLKIFPPNLEQKYGLKRRDRLGSESKNPVWYHVEKVRATLGIQSLDVYINPKRTHKIYIENTNPVSIIISQSLLDALSDIEIRFILSKYMFYIAQNQTLTFKLEIDKLQRYFKCLREGFMGIKSSLAEDEAYGKKLKGAIPRKLRKTLEERTDIWLRTQKEKLTSYIKHMEFASNRCGLIMTDSLELSIQMIYRLNILARTNKLVKVDKIAIQDMAKLEAVYDLLLYNLSDEYDRLRKRVE